MGKFYATFFKKKNIVVLERAYALDILQSKHYLWIAFCRYCENF